MHIGDKQPAFNTAHSLHTGAGSFLDKVIEWLKNELFPLLAFFHVR